MSMDELPPEIGDQMEEPNAPAMAGPAMAGLTARLSSAHGLPQPMAMHRARSIISTAMGKARTHSAMSRTKIH